MKCKLILSGLLLITCLAAFSQEKQSDITNSNGSVVMEKGLIKVSIMYPFAEGKTFNMEYYETKHMPMVAKFLGSNLVKYTIEKGVADPFGNARRPVEIAHLPEPILHPDGGGAGEAQNARRQELGSERSPEGLRARVVELEVDTPRRRLG